MSEQPDRMRVLIVEDEHLERQAIKLILEKAAAPFIVVGEARNGNEAVRMAAELKPDIILLDIKMPGMDGLTGAREIRKFLPSTVIIFLTAYDEFDYAKEALRAGAVDYLLKPLASEDLLEILEKARNLILEEKLKQEERNKIQEQLAEALPWLRVNLGLGLISCSWEDRAAVEKQASLVQLEVLPQVAFGVYLEERSLKDISSSVGLELLRYQLQQIVENALSHYPFGLCLPLSEKMLIGLWGTNQPEPEQRLRQLAEYIIKTASDKLSLGITVGLGSFCEDITYLPHSVWEAQTAAHLGMFYLGPEHVINIHEMGEENDRDTYTCTTREKEIVEALRSGNQEEVRCQFRKFLGAVSKGRGTDIYLIKARLMGVLVMFVRLLGWGYQEERLRETEYSYFEFARRMELCRSLEDLEEWLVDLAIKAEHVFSKKSGGSMADSLKRVLSYIHDNYQRELSLTELSRVIFLSPDYFSRVFKEQVGCTFSEYILNLRMEKAKELLADTELPVGEVARKVGFPDPNYFSRIFGRTAGVTPSRFRQSVIGCRNKRISGVW